ncbi:hypothetical protein ES705_16373 [subsurface metagenome]
MSKVKKAMTSRGQHPIEGSYEDDEIMIEGHHTGKQARSPVYTANPIRRGLVAAGGMAGWSGSVVAVRSSY